MKDKPNSVSGGAPAAIPGVKTLFAVASGKGGVGKSTVAVNLALALAAEGGTVGLLDADIYGPSQPLMLGVGDERPRTENNKMLPIEKYGLQSMSIGYLVDDKAPMVWRGPMVSMALQQMLQDTAWRDLDYLVVDLPPGTGDIQLTLAQKVPVTAAVIVTTPQDIALLDARRAIEMFSKVRIPIAGIIENMSVHVCSQCGHEEDLFGSGGGERIASQYDVSLLGKIPLQKSIREWGDAGKPTLVQDKTGRVAMEFRAIAKKLMQAYPAASTPSRSKFPKITVRYDE